MNDRKTLEEYKKTIDELLINFHRIYPFETVLHDRDLCIEAMGYLRACRLIALIEFDAAYIDMLYSDLSIILVDHDRTNI